MDVYCGLLHTNVLLNPPLLNDYTVNNGFIGGEEFLSFSQDRQRDYVMGVVDGLGVREKNADARWLSKRTTGASNEQVRRVVVMYLSSSLQPLNMPMSMLVLQSLQRACPE